MLEEYGQLATSKGGLMPVDWTFWIVLHLKMDVGERQAFLHDD